MQKLDQSTIETLKDSLKKFLHGDKPRIQEREHSASTIRNRISDISVELGLQGEVKMFGSFLNGFKTGGSDLDIVFVTSGKQPETSVSLLSRFAAAFPKDFQNMTKIFKANTPLLKFTDMSSSMEVDFCINNRLGVRNSHLLQTYCMVDERVNQVGKLVKEWAKANEAVGTADGCLNSYAYMLLVIHFLQRCSPPVVPNLQTMAKDSVPVTDDKWGCDDTWDTKFVENISNVPKSKNTQDVAELLVGFFYYYAHEFDWSKHAVCMRLNHEGATIDKFSLLTPSNEDQWYIEDPFDLKHNLAGKCTWSGKKRILDDLRETYQILSTSGDWGDACPDAEPDAFFLKCRVSAGVSPPDMMECFEEFDLKKLHFPKHSDSKPRSIPAFLEFGTNIARRRAHSKNETYVADCQLQLHFSTSQGLADVMLLNNKVYTTYNVASYKMQRQILQARAMPGPQQQEASHEEPLATEDADAGYSAEYADTGYEMMPPYSHASLPRPTDGMPPPGYAMYGVPIVGPGGMQPVPGIMTVPMGPGFMRPPAPPPAPPAWIPADAGVAMAEMTVPGVPVPTKSAGWVVPDGDDRNSFDRNNPWIVADLLQPAQPPEKNFYTQEPTKAPLKEPPGFSKLTAKAPAFHQVSEKAAPAKAPNVMPGLFGSASTSQLPLPSPSDKAAALYTQAEMKAAAADLNSRQSMLQSAAAEISQRKTEKAASAAAAKAKQIGYVDVKAAALHVQQQKEVIVAPEAKVKVVKLENQKSAKVSQVPPPPPPMPALPKPPMPALPEGENHVLGIKVEIQQALQIPQDIWTKVDELKEWRKGLAQLQLDKIPSNEIHVGAHFAGKQNPGLTLQKPKSKDENWNPIPNDKVAKLYQLQSFLRDGV